MCAAVALIYGKGKQPNLQTSKRDAIEEIENILPGKGGTWDEFISPEKYCNNYMAIREGRYWIESALPTGQGYENRSYCAELRG
jgi:hypothetical protein